jgi:hypothetical protein
MNLAGRASDQAAAGMICQVTSGDAADAAMLKEALTSSGFLSASSCSGGGFLGWCAGTLAGRSSAK